MSESVFEANIPQTETLFHTYSQFANKSDIDPRPSDEEEKTEQQLNEILEKVGTACPIRIV